MNNIVIEGHISDFYDEGFILEVIRVFDNGVRTYHFIIKDNRKKFYKGQSVRVVGYLAEDKGKVVVIADYAECIGKEVA